MKKYILLLFSILILSVFAGCSAPKADYTPKEDNIAVETNSTDLTVISRLIADNYLGEYMKTNVVKELRLKDYEIISIGPMEGTTTYFTFEVLFSVKPAAKNSLWHAGNGHPSGSWIKKKSTIIKAEKSGSKYVMISQGSGL